MEQKGPCRNAASKPLSVHETLCHREGRTGGRESAALGRGRVSFVNRPAGPGKDAPAPPPRGSRLRDRSDEVP